MKISRLICLLVGAAAVLALGGCGTNEENYKKAYDKAKEAGDKSLEGTIYNRIREQSRNEKIVSEGDTVNVTVEYVTAAKDAGFTAEKLQRYNAVVGQFKQLFHAKSMRNRMAEGGYPEAIIIETGEPLYYVVALSSQSLEDVKATADSLRKSSPVKLREEFPVILRASNR